MSSEKQIEFTKENINTYLKEVAKEYRKQIGKNMPAEMILIGGASILVNYGFNHPFGRSYRSPTRLMTSFITEAA